MVCFGKTKQMLDCTAFLFFILFFLFYGRRNSVAKWEWATRNAFIPRTVTRFPLDPDLSVKVHS